MASNVTARDSVDGPEVSTNNNLAVSQLFEGVDILIRAGQTIQK